MPKGLIPSPEKLELFFVILRFSETQGLQNAANVDKGSVAIVLCEKIILSSCTYTVKSILTLLIFLVFQNIL